MSETLKILNTLTQTISISGDEKNVGKCMAQYLEPYCDEIVYDNLGSVFGVKKSKKENAKRVLVITHMDESGLMITKINDNGSAEFIEIGKINKQYLPGSRLRVKTKTGEVNAFVVGTEKMVIDFGTYSKEETLALGVFVGDSAVVDGPFVKVQKQCISKALESRVGCLMAGGLLKAVKDKELDFDLYVGACVMEEVGQRGATTATGLVKPDLGVVLGCKKAKTLDEKDQSVGELGKGLLVSFYDKGMMPNRGLLDALVQICKEEDIAYQHYYSMDLNEGAWVHKLFAGCPTLNVSIAIQNAYSAIESMDLNDYDCAKKALTVFVEHLNEEKIQEFKESNR